MLKLYKKSDQALELYSLIHHDKMSRTSAEATAEPKVPLRGGWG